MLGGSVYIAFIRFVIGLVGVTLLYFPMSELRFDRKKAIGYYAAFGMVMAILACIWYVVDRQSCVRCSTLVMFTCFAAFSVFMSNDSIYLSLYKLALTFYLLAVFLIGGLEIAILFFDGSIWADIVARSILMILLTVFLHKKLKSTIQGFSEYVEKELDNVSVAVMILSLLLGIGYILNPSLQKEGLNRLFRILTNFLLVGTLQFLVFRFYLHVGKEKEYERENQLIQMNHRLLARQLEILEESLESGRRIRHDVRHHNAVIAEYARRGEKEELLQYLEECDRGTEQDGEEKICANAAVNNILSAYTRKARKEQIQVTLDIELSQKLSIANIDLVAIIANAYENAIYACIETKKHGDAQECFIQFSIKRKDNKLIFCCRNTCRLEAALNNGKPKKEFTGGIGVSSIVRTAEKYGGEYDFKNDNGVFIFRLIMNIPSET